jgi:hypothetical protein
MATTTPNFGWDIPQSTDLVKDGATAIAALGTDIDTSLVDLKGGTTGQVLSKNSNTDMDFTWVAQDDSNAIQNALLTTTGDTIYASAASTPARLGIGTTGQVLTVAGGLPSWASPASVGNIVQIATGTLSGASVTISSLSSYSDLFLIVYDNTNSTADGRPIVRINADTGSNYTTIGAWQDGTNNPTQTKIINGTYIPLVDEGTNRTNSAQSYSIRLTNTKNAGFTNYAIDSFFTVSTRPGHFSAQGIYTSSAAVSSLVISNLGGNWSAGTYTLWGG